MQDAFFPLLVAVMALALVIGIWAIAGSGEELRRLGRGDLALRDEDDPPEPPPWSAAATAIRDEEIRQLVVARNARRLRMGREPLDVDAEVARQLRDLTGS